jgi:hypothetical protein
MKVKKRKKNAATNRTFTRSAQTVQYRVKIAIIRFQNAMPDRNAGFCVASSACSTWLEVFGLA